MPRVPPEDTKFKPGQSGNPSGRPKGLARVAREKVGSDGVPLIQFWLDTMNDVTVSRRERLDASKLLAERGWGKPAGFQLIEDEDPLGAKEENLDAAVERFNAEVIRLADARRTGDSPGGRSENGDAVTG